MIGALKQIKTPLSIFLKVNVLLLGLAFMLIFTGYITMAGIQVSDPNSSHQTHDHHFIESFLQTIIFASASTPGSGGFVPGFKVLVEAINDLAVS